MDYKDFDFGIVHVPFEESGLGHMSEKMDGQLEELRRIADAAEQRAKLAEEEAESAKNDAKSSRRIAIISLLISLITVLHEVGPDVIAFVTQLIQFLQQSI